MESYFSVGEYDKSDSQIQSLPTNSVRSGRYNYDYGNATAKNQQGFYWLSEASPHTNDRAGNLYFSSAILYPQYYYYKGFGFSLRCLSASSLLFLCWQLPTYSGTKSYQNLLVEVYGGENVGNNRDASIQRNPLGFIHVGEYRHGSGEIYGIASNGLYWQSRTESIARAMDLVFYRNSLSSSSASDKGLGISLRCLVC